MSVLKDMSIDGDGAIALQNVPDECGALALACSQVGGLVEQVVASSENLRRQHEELLQATHDLARDQALVANASEEAHLLSEQAVERLRTGSQLVGESLGNISQLLEFVRTLGDHVTGFAAAMEQVRKSSLEIDRIAETTSILALNATIEAARAGDEGQTFGTVADEVKALSSDTRRATEEIQRTVGNLASEASAVVEQIDRSADKSRSTGAAVKQIERGVSGVISIVEEVDRLNRTISTATALAGTQVGNLQATLSSFGQAAQVSENKLGAVCSDMEELEWTASDMFDSIVKAGLSAVDDVMVELAMTFADRFTRSAEEALKAGELALADLKDQDYSPIAGSHPPRFRSRLTDWADRVWRPIIDEGLAYGRPVKMFAVADENGFLPTHATERSQQQTGDIVHDTLFCRNGRIILAAIDRKARKSNARYMMAVHRQEGGGGDFYVVRNVFVPLYIAGLRWGVMELAYILDDAAWPKA